MSRPEQPQFRVAPDDDLDALARLASGSFSGSGRDPVAWRSEIAGMTTRGELWAGYDGDRAVAFCVLYRMRQWVRGTALPMCGVGMVSVALSHRRRGIGRRLMETGLEHAAARGDVASALFPFRGGFYERLGYGWAGTAEQIEVAPAALPPDSGARRAHLVEDDERMTAVRACYDRWIRAGNGQVEREKGAWDAVRRGNAAVVAVPGGDGEVRGYAVAYSDDGTLEVREIVWEDADARDALLGWLSSVGDQYRRIRVRTHPRERIVERLLEVRGDLPGNVAGAAPWELWFPAAATLRGPMFRVLDLPGILEAGTWASDGRFALEVEDPVLEANRGGWDVHVEGGAARVRRAEAGAATVIRTSIVGLSRLVIGDLLPSEAVEIGLADAPVDALPELDAIFATPRPWTFERF